MPFVTVGAENSANIDIYYEDLGSGDPVVLIHGYPLNGASWEKQIRALLAAGRRVIVYDRRGFGKSSQPSTGYDYDTFASDLHHLVRHLQLDDFSLAGFSMGGGEVVRYIGKYGSRGVRNVVIIGGVPPYLVKAPDNPEGVPQSVFDGIQKDIKADRFAFLTGFFQNFYDANRLLGERVSEEVLRASFQVAAQASPVAMLACVPAWLEDFREDLEAIDIPCLVIHGDADLIVPLDASGKRTAQAIKGAKLVIVQGGPHPVIWTHADEVNKEFLSFLDSPTQAARNQPG